jgi:alkaline phosphatase D
MMMRKLRRHAPTTINRRTLLRGALGAGLFAPSVKLATATAQTAFKTNPFTLGVASGDPAADGFVIWTRLAPEPLLGRGGMAPAPVDVTWEIAADPEMKQIVRSGSTIARIEFAHSVHVETEGLEPARDYFYRFQSGGVESPIGRARTLPAAAAQPSQIKFGAAGCQAWEGGYYTAWRAVAEENFDFVFLYGDYIYEHGFVAADREGRPFPRIMPNDFLACFTLTDYRRRYALYKTDPDLQAAHASCPFMPSFDDHEVSNNWSSASDSRNTPQDALLVRQTAALQAWYEHMPVRRALLPRGPDMLSYRRFRFGSLADVAVLDTRQYRSLQPCGDGFKANCSEASEPGRSMLGAKQEQWLAEGLRDSEATWQVLAQQVLFSQFDWRSYPWVPDTGHPAPNLDAWDGTRAARDRVMDMLRHARSKNAVVLTGDVHRGAAFELKDDWQKPASACVGVEFLATSISSGGDGFAKMPNADALHANNPHLKFISDQRGYSRHVVTPQRWQADFRVVDQVRAQGGTVSTARSFVVEAGKPGLTDA